ncbi:uncharacterized protein FOMMEDRAFT_161240 [Fomitiporia mediterranea MF3/22]|uniref:uncharacterized protein n=1 Tax=Fomitiporia mediterranea (strain MF3/22) TaxID=694068 RepID=UPI0004407C6E|nr:uncharacterized protein FOMMEDRAFT_161240 [Fomitiporia mediterranea MF3/22]EJC99028.1 hypothetical protein FOMMEDRAFT_161240 [Fomitiporia mediterranea MF3/22]
MFSTFHIWHPSERRATVFKDKFKACTNYESTTAKRMNTMPVSAWGKNKMVMPSETVWTIGTIGTIGTEPGDLDASQFGSVSGTSSFLDRAKTENRKRLPVRRQTTSQSQASTCAEDYPTPLPFLKQSVDPSMRQSQIISFSSRTRIGIGLGPVPYYTDTAFSYTVPYCIRIKILTQKYATTPYPYMAYTFRIRLYRIRIGFRVQKYGTVLYEPYPYKGRIIRPVSVYGTVPSPK